MEHGGIIPFNDWPYDRDRGNFSAINSDYYTKVDFFLIYIQELIYVFQESLENVICHPK